MGITGDVENSVQEEIRAPLIVVEQRKDHPNGQQEDGSSKRESLWIVYLSTIVIVWGSFEFGCCVGYSSPTQAAIRKDSIYLYHRHREMDLQVLFYSEIAPKEVRGRLTTLNQVC
ncbi:hypothetical protein GIB67_020157 [Kingdonia uniflora]|uniref:Uncharacterized protein n=1 Tax=Kingdonia uniflora TaxID=39325 RepID=A0A7J7M1F8_9MAGN|nr:hypothetical protein GIB67_020157 [Kingdonia uniflora]